MSSLKIVSWNCNGGFHKKYNALFENYPDADIYVIEECEDPFFNPDYDFRNIFQNGFQVGSISSPKTKGIGIIARKGIHLQRLSWDAVGDNSFVPVLVNHKLTLIATWTHTPYTEELHNFLDANASRIKGNTVMVGDFNSNASLDKPNKKRSHQEFVQRMENIGLSSLYHLYSGERQGEETTPTFYYKRYKDQPFHLDFAFANKEIVESMRIAEPDKHDFWLTLSDHMPIEIVLDLL